MRTGYDIIDMAGVLDSKRLYPAAEDVKTDIGPYVLSVEFILNCSPFDVPQRDVDILKERLEYLCSVDRAVERYSEIRTFAFLERYAKRGYEIIDWSRTNEPISSFSDAIVKVNLTFTFGNRVFKALLNFLIKLDKTSLLSSSTSCRICLQGKDTAKWTFKFPNTLISNIYNASMTMIKIINKVKPTGLERGAFNEIKDICRTVSPALFSEWEIRQTFSAMYNNRTIRKEKQL